jgi:hypothetical protein
MPRFMMELVNLHSRQIKESITQYLLASYVIGLDSSDYGQSPAVEIYIL